MRAVSNGTGAARAIQAALQRPAIGRSSKALAPGNFMRQQHARLRSGHYHLPRHVPQRRLSLGSDGSARSLSTRHDRSSDDAPSFAFAFDIDGVLLHVSTPIPGAAEALDFLHAHNIPYILLTNGGGKHETERVADLSAKLGVSHLTTANFVQSHTPFQALVPSLRDKTILVTGANAAKCRAIAEAYGFGSVVTPADILAAEPRVWPFELLAADTYAAQARSLPKPLYDAEKTVPEGACLKIDAVFVFNDPRDWAVDIQLVTDLLLSRNGVLGTYSAKNGDSRLPGCGWQGDGQPTLHFSNADLLWSTGYAHPRFGQGAFQAAVAGVWRRLTGGHELQRRVMGKPSRETYRYAEGVLARHRHDILQRSGRGHNASGALKSVYMVGDNPESDIAGANDFESDVGTEWASVLVRTGVWSPDRGGGEEALSGSFRPTVVVKDVREALRWALEREGWAGRF